MILSLFVRATASHLRFSSEIYLDLPLVLCRLPSCTSPLGLSHCTQPAPSLFFLPLSAFVESLQRDQGIGKGREEIYGMKAPNYPIGLVFGRLS